MNENTSDGASDNPYLDVTAVNPYQASATPSNDRAWGDHAQGKKFILEVARWQTFFAVLLSIGLIFVIGVLLVQVAFGGGFNLIGGILCGGAVGLIFCAIPALLLWRASVATKYFVASESMDHFTDYARAQATFWRVIGILAIIVGVGYAAMMVALTSNFQS